MECNFGGLYLLSPRLVDGRRERDMPRDTCQDDKQMKIMFGQGPEQLALCSALGQLNSTRIVCFEKGKIWSQSAPLW